ncbi:hypothetical protein D9758_013206 [Tetrapyrgos nigripes]|uniref:Uncharacterized protein n=1 Tax=Tetrapyrgos nigripes TaxID=182062 RepID=A0A8H5CS66_9AGAR|nr:hypothetical protein D9758_013206 [Tetrapyrgos nigripes]
MAEGIILLLAFQLDHLPTLALHLYAILKYSIQHVYGYAI